MLAPGAAVDMLRGPGTTLAHGAHHTSASAVAVPTSPVAATDPQDHAGRTPEGDPMKRTSLTSVALVAACSLALPALPATAGTSVPPAVDGGGARAAEPTGPAATRPAAVLEAFRVLPYLQKPAQDQMTLVWFTGTSSPGTVDVAGSGTRGKLRFVSQPEYQPLLEYTDEELAEDIPGLAKGSWLKGAANYKHTVTVTGLRPDRSYRYTVEQDGARFTDWFRTAPTPDRWQDVRLIAFSDTETEPRGRVEHREWELNPVSGYAPGSVPRPGPGSLWDQRYGSTTRYDEFTLRYPLNQDRAMRENVAWIEKADPDLMLVVGDLAQGSGYQPAWDEFFGYVAGEHGDLASHTPLVTALGNWETFAALSGGYGTPDDRTPVVRSRNRYHAYFETFGDPANPQLKDSYHRVDHGPVTVITLDSTNGVPDESTVTGPLSNPVFSGDDSSLTQENLSTDTQGEFTEAEYDAAFTRLFPGTTAADSDLPNLNGTEQWEWAQAQLADARAAGQIVVVQFHHAAYSSGVHGTPPNHEFPDNQSGVAMRAYTPMFERYGVAAVLSGHDEMFERSWVDSDGDGLGFHSYDVGVAADGLRGEQLVQQDDGTWAPLRFNTHSEWMAATDEPELWVLDAEGRPRLQDGGLHYGHLQIDVTNTACGARMVLTPVYLFPVMDADLDVLHTERRVYDDVVTVGLDEDGQPLAAPC